MKRPCRGFLDTHQLMRVQGLPAIYRLAFSRDCDSLFGASKPTEAQRHALTRIRLASNHARSPRTIVFQKTADNGLNPLAIFTLRSPDVCAKNDLPELGTLTPRHVETSSEKSVRTELELFQPSSQTTGFQGHSMVSKCANPNCSAKFLYLRLGKLFWVETSGSRGKEEEASAGDLKSGKPAERRMEYFWLCEDCASKMTVTAEPGAGAAVTPILRARAASG